MARLRPPVRAQKRNFRGQLAFLPAHIRPINGRNTTVMGLTAMDSVTRTIPSTTRRVAA